MFHYFMQKLIAQASFSLFFLLFSCSCTSMEQPEVTAQVQLLPKQKTPIYTSEGFKVGINESWYEVVRHVSKTDNGIMYFVYNDITGKALLKRELPLSFKNEQDFFETINKKWQDKQSSLSSPYDFQKNNQNINDNL